MVRTKANSAAVRKAVAAKAPRKSLPSSSSALSPSSGSNKKKAKINGGNSLKVWPTPKWQKGLHTFLGIEQPGSSGLGSSSSSSANTSLTEADMAASEQLGAGTSSAGSSRCLDEHQGSSSLSGVVSGIELLSSDIAQLNSDSESDD